MSSQDNEERYQDILKRIAQRRPFGSKRQEQTAHRPHDCALDRINAFDCLAQLTRRKYRQHLCHGPKALRGPAWSGVVIWTHRKGYFGYQTLTLFGVWTHYAGDEIMISIGRRQLPYRAPVYDPGVYRVAIENNFRIYYDDAGGPRDERDSALYRCGYHEEERLTHRRALQEIVQGWRNELEAF